MIGVIDYGLGNINAFLNIYRKAHIEAKALKTKSDFYGIDKLILPGVGAFDYAIESFNDSGMREITEELVLNKKIPIIGICVGMQMLANFSDEGNLKGLGWMNAAVKKFDVSKIHYSTKLPHMGWNDVEVDSSSPLFKNFPHNPKFYFLHSYYFLPENINDSIAKSNYGSDFVCAVNSENIFGVQFHPEKSHKFGTILLENFAKIPC